VIFYAAFAPCRLLVLALPETHHRLSPVLTLLKQDPLPQTAVDQLKLAVGKDA
jgi:hypothetical protein